MMQCYDCKYQGKTGAKERSGQDEEADFRRRRNPLEAAIFCSPFRETKTPFNISSNTLESSLPALVSKTDAAHYQCPSLTIIN
jgi:hypothetical protein